MGLVLDTTLFVKIERASDSVTGFSRAALAKTREVHFAVSAITLMELAFGQTQTASLKYKAVRQRFILEIQENFTILAVTDGVALRAGLLRGSILKLGFTIGLADILIAATALEAGFGVLTHNVKHFSPIPNLRVVSAETIS